MGFELYYQEEGEGVPILLVPLRAAPFRAS